MNRLDSLWRGAVELLRLAGYLADDVQGGGDLGPYTLRLANKDPKRQLRKDLEAIDALFYKLYGGIPYQYRIDSRRQRAFVTKAWRPKGGYRLPPEPPKPKKPRRSIIP